MTSLRTLSRSRLRPGIRRSPTDGSPIFLSARTASNRTSGSRSCPMVCTSSGIAAEPFRMPSPRLAARRMPSWLSLSRARSAVTTDASTGTSGSTTVSAYSSVHGLIRLPNFMSAAVGPVWRGRCRFTSACTARSRMSASLSAESVTKPESVWMSFISSSVSSTWRRTPASGSSVSGSSAGMAGRNLAVPRSRAASRPPPRIGVLEVVNQAVRGHLTRGLRAGGARAQGGAERQYNWSQPPGSSKRIIVSSRKCALCRSPTARRWIRLAIVTTPSRWSWTGAQQGGKSGGVYHGGARVASSWSIIGVPSGGPYASFVHRGRRRPRLCAGCIGRRAALEQGSPRHRRPFPPQRHERRGAQEILGGHARRDGGEDRRAGRRQISGHRAHPAGAAADGPDQGHGVRPHRLRCSGRSRAHHESGGERLPADDRPRARARPGGRRGDGNRRAVREVLVSGRPRRREGRARDQRGQRAVRPSSITTCTSSTSSTSRCSSGT